MHIIALSGKRGSGKTSCARYLKNQYGATIISMATPIKQELVAMGFDEALVYVKPTPPPIRELMVALGKARRYVDPDHFIKLFLKELAPHYVSGTGLVVCDDVRYVNEMDRLTSYGATRIRLECTNLLDVQEFVPGVDDDVSEISLDSWHEWDHIITADHGRICSLFEQVEFSLKEVIK